MGVIIRVGSCPGGNVRIPYIVTQCFLTITCLIKLHSHFKSISKLILCSAGGGLIMIISFTFFISNQY